MTDEEKKAKAEIMQRLKEGKCVVILKDSEKNVVLRALKEMKEE